MTFTVKLTQRADKYTMTTHTFFKCGCYLSILSVFLSPFCLPCLSALQDFVSIPFVPFKCHKMTVCDIKR